MTCLEPADADEVDMLDMAFDVGENHSRLTCQIAVSDQIAGTVFQVMGG